jgi:hypothetical protein
MRRLRKRLIVGGVIALISLFIITYLFIIAKTIIPFQGRIIIMSPTITLCILSIFLEVYRPDLIITEELIILSNQPILFLAWRHFKYFIRYDELNSVRFRENWIAFELKNGKYLRIDKSDVDNFTECSNTLFENAKKKKVKFLYLINAPINPA